jgi:quinol monooxygenase YgiN
MSMAPDAPVLVLVELKSQPDDVAELGALLRSTLIPVTRSYEGCEGLSLHVNQDDPGHFLVLQRWTSRKRFESYLEWRRERGDLPRLQELLSGPPTFRYFDDTGS